MNRVDFDRIDRSFYSDARSFKDEIEKYLSAINHLTNEEYSTLVSGANSAVNRFIVRVGEHLDKLSD